MLLRPGVERRILVVDEEAAIAHLRLIATRSRGDEDVCLARHGDIGEPVPRRDADPFRQIVDAVHSAALIGSHDHERTRDTGERALDDDLPIRLPLPDDVTRLNLPGAHQPIDDGAVPKHADDDHIAARTVSSPQTLRLPSADALQIGRERVGGMPHSWIGIGIDEDRSGSGLANQREAAFGLLQTDRRRRSTGVGPSCRQRKQRGDARPELHGRYSDILSEY